MSEPASERSNPADSAPWEAQIAELRTELAWKDEELKARGDAVVAAAAEARKFRDAVNASLDQATKFSYQLLNAFDPLLGDQARAVVDICGRMAKSKYFSDEERKDFLAAAWLHDLGLISFHRSILHKMYSAPVSLTGDEQKSLRQHPVRGQQLAFFADNMRHVGEIIRAHHERFDGTGYPDGFAGETIPWAARCLAIAVFYVECGLLKTQALDAILKQSGTGFDPDAVRLFFKMTQADSLPHQIREVMVDELTPGMCLADAIYSNAGLLLFPEGVALTDATIAKIKNHNMLSSVTQRFLVYR